MRWKVHRETISNADETKQEGGTFILDADSERDIAYIPVQSNKQGHAELIAAAPELLEMLELLLSEYEDQEAQFGDQYLWKEHAYHPSICKIVRETITKAKG